MTESTSSNPTLKLTGSTLRLLLVSTRESCRDAIGEALDGWISDYRLFWVSQPDLAVGRAQELLPQVILVDDDLAGASPSAFVGLLNRQVPSAACLVLIDPDNTAEARRAVLVGARGFFVKPVQGDELATTLQQLLGQEGSAAAQPASAQIAQGRVVVFCAPKGGTGRTTLAINTAISLQQAAQAAQGTVALVDADYASPAIDVALNLQGQRTIIDLLPRLARLDQDAVLGVMAQHASGVRALLAPPPETLEQPITLPQVQEVLTWLKRIFPWVIVDLGLPMDETAFAFLDSADRIVISVVPEMVGLRNTKLLLDQLRARGYTSKKILLVLNRADLKGGVSPSDIEKRLHITIADRIPDDQPLATYSINRGVPLVMSHRRSALARAFSSFAQHLQTELPHAPGFAAEDEGRRGGLFGLFGKRSI